MLLGSSMLGMAAAEGGIEKVVARLQGEQVICSNELFEIEYKKMKSYAKPEQMSLHSLLYNAS